MTDERPAQVVRVKARDMYWTVFVVDLLAVPATSVLQRWHRVTPDVVTVVAALLGVLAGVVFASGHLVVGGLAYQLSFFVDCMDGKLARHRPTTHGWGGYLDQAGDAIRMAACSLGLVYGLVQTGYDAPAEVLLAAAYPIVRGLLFTLYAARHEAAGWRSTSPGAGALDLRPSPIAVLRAAPARRASFGSTVDTETAAFTLGPVTGLPLVGLGVAIVGDGLLVVRALGGALRRAARHERPDQT